MEEFGLLLLPLPSRGHGVRINRPLWSIGADREHSTFRRSSKKREKRSQGQLASVGGEEGEGRVNGGRGGMGKRGSIGAWGKSESGKQFLRSFKELLFHGKLKSHYKDYMAENNVRQISI